MQYPVQQSNSLSLVVFLPPQEAIGTRLLAARSGEQQVWKIPANGGDAIQRQFEFSPQCGHRRQRDLFRSGDNGSGFFNSVSGLRDE